MERKITVNLLKVIHIYKDIIAGGLLFISFLLVMICSMNIKQSSMNVIGSAFMPKLISGIMLFVSVLILFQGMASISENKNTLPEFTEEYLYDISKRILGVAKTLLLLLMTIIMLRIIGFVITGFIFLVCQITLLTLKEERNYKLIIIQSIVITLVTYIIFRYGFSIILPAGMFA